MAHSKLKWLALLASAVLTTGSVLAQDSGPLIDLLVKKGIVNDQEAEDLRADLSKNVSAALATTGYPKISNLEKLAFSGRFQAQFAGIATGIDNAAVQPNYTNHFFLRRIYLGVKAQYFKDWSGNLNYDFAGSTFDAAFIQWKPSDQLILDIGFRKAPIGYEEWSISSGSLKAIERSPATRYFVEGNNGRRLGAGSYRQGLFLGGSQGSWSYNVAVTNPEREESSAGAAGAGSKANNSFAYWGNVGYGGKLAEGAVAYKLGASVGYLPDQGGKTLGVGDNLTVYSVYTDWTFGNFAVVGEYFWSDNDHGVSPTLNARSSAFWIMPTYRVGAFEAVVRYSAVDSDGRGVDLGDGVRSAPSGGTMNKLTEWYFGGNWYLVGTDVKLQAGYVSAQSENTVTGGPAKAKSDGFRSQMQVQF